MNEQDFTGWIGAIHRAVMRCANLVSTPDSPVRGALSPAYATLQYALTGGRGVVAEINGDVYRIAPRFRWRLHPAYEADVAAFLRARIKPGQCCMEVGANIGHLRDAAVAMDGGRTRRGLRAEPQQPRGDRAACTDERAR